MANNSWRLYVDTGGTFTDALAIAPDGGWRRVKVLSSGALRGTVSESIGPRELAVTVAWQATADPLRGGHFRILGSDAAAITVTAFDPATSRLHLADQPATEIPAGATFEVNSGEEAPVLAARDKNGKFHAFLNACRHRGAQG